LRRKASTACAGSTTRSSRCVSARRKSDPANRRANDQFELAAKHLPLHAGRHGLVQGMGQAHLHALHARADQPHVLLRLGAHVN
jgi:hypothetical protein